MSDTHDGTAEIIPISQAEPPQTMHPLVAAIQHQIERGELDPQTLREVFELQREYDRERAKRLFAEAKVALKRDLPTILPHDKPVEFNGKVQYTHTTLAAVFRAAIPHLTNYGFDLSWSAGTLESGRVAVTTKLLHIGGHEESFTLESDPDKSGHKNDPQSIGSTMSFLERYGALAILGIVTEDMGEEFHGRPEPDPDSVSTKRNLSAARWVVKQGLRRPDAEAELGRSVAEWTHSDLDRLKLWVAEQIAAKKPVRDHDPAAGELSDEELEAMDRERAL